MTRVLNLALALAILIVGVQRASAQVLTNPTTLMCLNSSTGQPVPASPQNPCPVTTVPGATPNTENLVQLNGNTIDLGLCTGGLATQRTILDQTSPGIIPLGPTTPANSVPLVVDNTTPITVTTTTSSGAPAVLIVQASAPLNKTCAPNPLTKQIPPLC